MGRRVGMGRCGGQQFTKMVTERSMRQRRCMKNGADVLQSVISMLCVFHSCKVVSHHISGDHVCYVQVDEAELSSSATLNC